MARMLRKRTLFLMGILITTIVGSFSGFIKNNFFKSGSLIATAYADISSGSDSGGGDSSSDSGSGDAGCSDGCY